MSSHDRFSPARLFPPLRRAVALAFLVPFTLSAQAAAAPKVGPAHGTVIVVGGGNWGPEVYQAFIAAAGGPDALIIDVPNAEGPGPYTDTNAPEARLWRQNGANNVHVLFTTDRKIADTDSFVAILAHAGGVWFEGGRHYRYVDAYAGTKTEAAFNAVLARGGVVGGSSAGASILGDFLVRGAPSNDNNIMDYPGYEKGFAYLRGVGIDQHVVARERLPDFADSLMPKYPKLLGISGDEGTAWVIHGDSAHIIGRNKTFVYGGNDPTDPGSPFLTLHPGDDYNLATRHVTHRAIDDSKVSMKFITSMFSTYDKAGSGGATVLVARDGEVLIDRSFGIPAQPKYMPTTAVPQFDIGGIAAMYAAFCSALPAPAARGRAATTPPPDSAAGAALGRHLQIQRPAVAPAPRLQTRRPAAEGDVEATGHHPRRSRHASPVACHPRLACTAPWPPRMATFKQASTRCTASRSASTRPRHGVVPITPRGGQPTRETASRA